MYVSADTQINKHGIFKRKVILGPVGYGLCVLPAGQNILYGTVGLKQATLQVELEQFNHLVIMLE